ncbi:ATP-binding cassette domain-containing protein [Paenibacillus dokdonensis]|uniref:ATP-binding cassette domain-containing protein n=1 Tax=Paenibacillus dokdonensis TaxID=2567944 RepID=A0ABU6GMB0_9BACL|nr:ATP-binding cassette domain-containing protein [Paenibacillus dokdonensis]MEC0240875.1 ATP-binding cassette domain-containing protein [Paenibacillus dokdonensis]
MNAMEKIQHKSPILTEYQENIAAAGEDIPAAESSKAVTDMVLLEELSFAYDGQHADIHDISLTIGKGEWVTLVGANGCGKSTLIRLMNGLLRTSHGRIYIGGIRLEPGTLGEIRQKVGMVFQNPDNQFIGATVEEDMAFGMEGRCLDAGEMRSRISRYASRLGISSLLHRHPQELSGGQKQRAAVAAILAMEPELIILDEASSMLDEKARRDWLGLLQEMHNEARYTLLSITHDAEEIAASQRVLVMHQGGLAADLAPQELFRDEGLLRLCRMEPPFGIRLALELEKRGMIPAQQGMADGSANPGSEVKRIWPFSWSK